MKRFATAATVFGISTLAALAIFQLFTASEHQPENRIAPIALQTAQAEYMKAPGSNKVLVPVTSGDAKAVAPAPVYDAIGRIVALNPNGSNNRPIILSPITSMKVAPVYDASGSLVSDPTGTIQATNNAKIAPAFDVNGEVISDPTGTLVNASNP